MNIRDVSGIRDDLIALVEGAGLTTVEAVRDAGIDGLTAISGIGDKTAQAILDALPPAAPTPDGDPAAAPTGDGDPTAAPTGDALPTADPRRLVWAFNAGSGAVVLAGKYLFPGESRQVRANQVPDTLTIKEL